MVELDTFVESPIMPLPSHRLLAMSTTVGMLIIVAADSLADWPIIGDPTNAGTASRVAWALVFPAVLLLIWALATLGRLMFSVHPPERLVTAGPYRHVRHPAALALIVGLAGLALATNNWLAIGAVVLIIIPVQILRARREEIELSETFGTEWNLYAEDSWFLIPYVW